MRVNLTFLLALCLTSSHLLSTVKEALGAIKEVCIIQDISGLKSAALPLGVGENHFEWTQNGGKVLDLDVIWSKDSQLVSTFWLKTSRSSIRVYDWGAKWGQINFAVSGFKWPEEECKPEIAEVGISNQCKVVRLATSPYSQFSFWMERDKMAGFYQLQCKNQEMK